MIPISGQFKKSNISFTEGFYFQKRIRDQLDPLAMEDQALLKVHVRHEIRALIWKRLKQCPESDYNTRMNIAWKPRFKKKQYIPESLKIQI